jgi:hypothetical protein
MTGSDSGIAALVKDGRGRLKPREGQVDAQRRLPDDLGDRSGAPSASPRMCPSASASGERSVPSSPTRTVRVRVCHVLMLAARSRRLHWSRYRFPLNDGQHGRACVCHATSRRSARKGPIAALSVWRRRWRLRFDDAPMRRAHFRGPGWCPPDRGLRVDPHGGALPRTGGCSPCRPTASGPSILVSDACDRRFSAAESTAGSPSPRPASPVRSTCPSRSPGAWPTGRLGHR